MSAPVTLGDSGQNSGNGASHFHTSLYHSHHYRQPPHLPRRLHLILCTIFQVEISPGDKCIVGKFIFVVSVFLSLGFLVLTLLYTVYDIKSAKTTQTVTTGLFGAFIILLWIAMTIYGNRLGKRILKSATFVDSLRVHSKTVFKIPATLLLFLMGLAALAIEGFRSYEFYWDMKGCVKVDLDGTICRVLFIFKVLQMITCLTFNICIAAAVLSICRTHTIGVRRFIRALEMDGHTCEQKHRQRFLKMQFAASHNLSEMYLPEQCYREESDTDSIDGEDDQHSLITYVPNTASKREGTVLSRDDILFSYWKLSSRMRMTSRVIQRWTGSWITFTILWLLKWIFAWLNHPATYLEIALFILPLVMSVIICTAYGETNSEAVKIVSCITPLQDRLDMIKTLPCIVIGMTLYNHPLVHANILTVVAGLGLALSSRMILDEFLPPSPHS
ncbi:uncharacterized protein [Watersipora subatra]|uniref:uncharacterized protein isoform X2 n=1 Tax=Watersipora subatra TaxID=2589382 RepID=UPI00355AE582